MGVHAVVAQHLGQRFQKGALAIGTVAVQKEHTLFSCRAAQAVAHHHLQIFGQLSIPAGDRLDERFPYGGFCQRIVVYLCHAGDVAFPVVGLKFPAGEIKDAVAHIQQTFVFIELVRQHGDARQMLGLFEEGFLAAAGTAFLHMAAHGTGRICVPDAKAGLVHLVQHLIRKALDRSKVIPLPAGAIPYHPALVCGVIAYPVGVAVAEAPGISGVVHGVGLDAGGRRSRGMRSIFCIQSAERFVLIGKGYGVLCGCGGVYLLAVADGALKRPTSVGLGPAPFIPFGTHQAGGTENTVHALHIGTKPERQQIAETEVCFAVAVVVTLPAACIQGGKAFAVAGGTGGTQQLFIGAVHLLPYGCGSRNLRCFRFRQIFCVYGGTFGAAFLDGKAVQGIAGNGEIPSAVVHFQSDAALAAGSGWLFSCKQQVYAGAAGT